MPSGFVDLVLDAPVGVSTSAALEASVREHAGLLISPRDANPDAVEAVASMEVGDLLAIVLERTPVGSSPGRTNPFANSRA